MFDLGLRQTLEQQAATYIEAQQVAIAQMCAAQRVGKLTHTVVIAASGNYGANTVFEHFFERYHLAGDVGAARHNHIE